MAASIRGLASKKRCEERGSVGVGGGVGLPRTFKRAVRGH